MRLRSLVIISAVLFLASCSGGEKARLSNPKTPYLAGGGNTETPEHPGTTQYHIGMATASAVAQR